MLHLASKTNYIIITENFHRDEYQSPKDNPTRIDIIVGKLITNIKMRCAWIWIGLTICKISTFFHDRLEETEKIMKM